MDKALQTMISNMPEKTGKSLEKWHELLAKKAFEKHSHGVKFLKTEHSVSHGFANTIVSLFNSQNEGDVNLVDEQYKGKEVLKPIYDQLINAINDLGSDIPITPKKTSVSLIRKRQFALIKPATKTRIDLGLKMPGKEVGTRLQNSGPFGTMCTHRVQISDISEVDDEVSKWLKEAYDKSI